MRPGKFDKLEDLAAALREHLCTEGERRDPQKCDMTGPAMFILQIRDRASENFGVSESEAQVADLIYPIKKILRILGDLGRPDRRRVESAITSYLEAKTGRLSGLRVAALEDTLKTFEQALVWQAAKGSFLVQPRSRAHEAVDWRRISVALACKRLWAKNAQRRQTPAWRKHVQDLPEDLAGPDASDFVLMDRLDSFEPSTVNRAAPGPFGRFLQAVLDVLPDRDNSGEPYNASDTLKALRRVQERKSRRP